MSGKQDMYFPQNSAAKTDEDYIDFIKFDSTVLIPGSQNPETKLQCISKETDQILPIEKFKKEILTVLKQNNVVIIKSACGTGKSLKLPQILHEAGYTRLNKKIAITQSKTVGVIKTAEMVSNHMKLKLGDEIGYQVKFKNLTSKKTIIEFMTENILLKCFILQPHLDSFSVIIIEEVENYSVSSNIIFGLLKNLFQNRSDLKVIISSATLEKEKFSSFFRQASVLEIPDLRFPIETYYLKAPELSYVIACVQTILKIHCTETLGDILVFLPAIEDIYNCKDMLNRRTNNNYYKTKIIVLTVYSHLNSEQLDRVFKKSPPGTRKIILATDILESSVTIPDLVYIIDTGLQKKTFFNRETKSEDKIISSISKDSATQRTGRIGRNSAGKCFRLYTLWTYYNEMPNRECPEIQRMNLAPYILILKSLGCHDLINFNFVDPPQCDNLIFALEQLYSLGALNHKGEVTEVGYKMLKFPVSLKMAKMILTSENYKCSTEIISIAAMLSIENEIFFTPKGERMESYNARKNFFKPEGDYLSLLNIYTTWVQTNYSVQWCNDNYIKYNSMLYAKTASLQFVKIMKTLDIEMSSNRIVDPVSIKKCIVAGYFSNAVKLSIKGNYEICNTKVFIHPKSCLADELPKWLIYNELLLQENPTIRYMKYVLKVEYDLLKTIVPHYFKALM